MDVEKPVQFLLEQQAASAVRMGELHTIVEQMALNQVLLGKAQARFDSNMRDLQSHKKRSDQRMEGSSTTGSGTIKNRSTEAMVQALVGQVDRLVKTLDGRFGTNGSGA